MKQTNEGNYFKRKFPYHFIEPKLLSCLSHPPLPDPPLPFCPYQLPNLSQSLFLPYHPTPLHTATWKRRFTSLGDFNFSLNLINNQNISIILPRHFPLLWQTWCIYFWRTARCIAYIVNLIIFLNLKFWKSYNQIFIPKLLVNEYELHIENNLHFWFHNSANCETFSSTTFKVRLHFNLEYMCGPNDLLKLWRYCWTGFSFLFGKNVVKIIMYKF